MRQAERSFDTIVIGGGLAGLTAAALLAHDRRQVLLLERRAWLGGRMATLRRRLPDDALLRFDRSAEALYGFGPGAIFDRVARRLGLRFPLVPLEPGLQLHLPNATIDCNGDRQAWPIASAEAFWQAQADLADRMSAWLDRLPALPSRSVGDLLRTLPTLRPDLLDVLVHRRRTVAHELRRRQVRDPQMQALIAALLLIGGERSPEQTPWPAGSLALDLPRRPAVYAAGGNGAISAGLADAFIRDGGELHMESEVTELLLRDRQIVGVRLRDGTAIRARQVIYSGSPNELPALLPDSAALRRRLARLPLSAANYCLAVAVPLGDPTLALQHLVIADPQRPPSDGNLVRISTHPIADPSRAPGGLRVLTLSTPLSAETSPADRPDHVLQTQLLAALEHVMPGAQAAITTVEELPFQAAQRRGLDPQSAAVDGLWVLDPAALPGPFSLAAAQSAVRLYRLLRFRRR